MAEKGLPGFVDKAGRQWSPEAYVRMDLRTTMGNTARAAQDARCDEWGIQLIEVSSHNGARPKCAPYQGRIFSRDGSRGVTRDLDGNQIEYIPLSETSYGEPDGLFGINCGHQQYPFIPGASVRRYYPYPGEENAEHYRVLQGQRALERKIRADKRECMMLQETGDEEGLRKAAGQLKADRQKYAAYSEAHGLGVHGDRTQVYGYDRSKSMKTVWAGRTNGSGTVGNAADSTGVAHMAAGHNDWSGATPIPHTSEEMKAISEYAKGKGINIYAPMQFDGDIDMLKEQIDVIDQLKNQFSINKKITIKFANLFDDEFANTDNYVITFNKKALRNRTITDKNLQADNYLSANYAGGISAHEMGHIISAQYGEKGLDIASQTYYNIYGYTPSRSDLLKHLKTNVSTYSVDAYEKKRVTIYREITPELISKELFGESDTFSHEFFGLLKGVV